MPNAFAHIELNTDDLEKAKKFYGAIFGWKLSDMPGPMPYTMIDVQDGTGGGMQTKQSPEMPSAWLPYVTVDSVKDTLAKAAKAGAQIALDYMPIGDMGAIGVFVDPSGASLGVWEAAKPATPPAKKPPAAKTAAKTAAKATKAAKPAAKPPAKAAKASKATKAPPAPAAKAAPPKGKPSKTKAAKAK
ncbi:MAG: VOC family protein [Deltaproteobacteria bacterium]|nr:VOC family protein [Deltaproteobacteria bacterium]